MGTLAAYEALIIFIWPVIGAIAGCLASTLVKDYGFGMKGNIMVGIAGAYIGFRLLPQFGFGGLILATVVKAVIGAVILLLIDFIKREA
jgi:uncharacterized membrane protein YeaQ/YmgE (transglycosylase-associated protein family)